MSIVIKTKREVELMREAGRIVALAHEAVKNSIAPGVSTAFLDQAAEKVILECGAKPSFKGYNGFPTAICASVNSVVVHGFPKESVILKEGDIISVDIGACYKGYHGDSAWTYPVGKISDENKRLLEVTEKALFAGLSKACDGARLSDISAAIESIVRPHGYGIVSDYTGHGVGSKLHEDPAIPNYGPKGQGPILRSGMTLAIEPMITLGTKHVKVLADHWTAVTRDNKNAAHFEHTIVITPNGYEILTVL